MQRGANFIGLGLIVFALLLYWLAYSGNYRATWTALLRPYKGGNRLQP